MPRSTDRELLKSCDLFRGLDPSALDEWRASAAVRPFCAGATLFQQGDGPTHLHLLASGEVKLVHLTAEGGQLALGYHQPGATLGCVAMMGSMPYPVTAISVEAGVTLAWTAAQVEALLGRHPLILRNAARLFCRQTEELLQRVRELTTERVEQRVARAVRRLGTRRAPSLSPRRPLAPGVAPGPRRAHGDDPVHGEPHHKRLGAAGHRRERAPAGRGAQRRPSRPPPPDHGGDHAGPDDGVVVLGRTVDLVRARRDPLQEEEGTGRGGGGEEQGVQAEGQLVREPGDEAGDEHHGPERPGDAGRPLGAPAVRPRHHHARLPVLPRRASVAPECDAASRLHGGGNAGVMAEKGGPIVAPAQGRAERNGRRAAGSADRLRTDRARQKARRFATPFPDG